MGYHTKPITFVGSVHLKVQQLERSIQFYESILGFKILERTASVAQLTADGKTSLLTLIQPEDVMPKEQGTTGLYHFAILLPERSDLANIVLHLAKQNIPFGSSDHLVSEALYFQDPDGNGIEVYCDRDSDEWDWLGKEVKMVSDPLDFESLLKQATPDKPWQTLPKATVMGHIHLHVSELQQTEEFYVKGLGMDIVNRYGAQALFFSYGNYHHHVGVNTWNGFGAPRPSERSAGLASFTLIFAHEEARQRAMTNLKQIGADVSVENKQVITYDPSGNCIELAI